MKSLLNSLNIFHYLNQEKWWYPNGLPRVKIATEMNDGWRRNAANWLVKRAELFEFSYSIEEIRWLEGGLGGSLVDAMTGETVSMMPGGDMACDAFEREQNDRAENPEEWIKTTRLYNALLSGLEV